MDNHAVSIRLRISGEALVSGGIDASELGQALLGWDRLLQLSYYSSEATTLSVPDAGTRFKSQLLISKVDRGSVVVDGLWWFSDHVASGLIGGGAVIVAQRVISWAKSSVSIYIESKQQSKTLDDAVDDLERVARRKGMRIKSNRIESEEYLKSIGAALLIATVPLDSAAAEEVLSLPGEDVDIVIDKDGRKAIRASFAPPEIDPDSEGIICAPVKFIRINKQTGNGIFEFFRPQDESQLGHQRFKCKDISIRRRANQYTQSFHLDKPIVVQMQRKVYDKNRSGHYWLIAGIVGDNNDDDLLFGML